MSSDWKGKSFGIEQQRNDFPELVDRVRREISRLHRRIAGRPPHLGTKDAAVRPCQRLRLNFTDQRAPQRCGTGVPA